MNKQVLKLLINERKELNLLRKDRAKCKSILSCDAIQLIIEEKLQFIDRLQDCL